MKKLSSLVVLLVCTLVGCAELSAKKSCDSQDTTAYCESFRSGNR